jgi:hypothetical protein
MTRASSRHTARVFVALATATLVLSSDAAAQEPTLDRVLARASDYVVKLFEQLSSIVAEETYRQHARTYDSSQPLDSRRILQSDLLLVRPTNADRYVEFRDVFSVDGKPMRDREERLTKLFLSPDAATSNQLKAIIGESARQNIGHIPRNINTPMLTLSFLQPQTRHRFRFKRAKATPPELAASSSLAATNSAVFRTSTEVWVIEFRETQSPTIIRTGRHQDFRAEGRFWIEPDTGTVRMSELAMENREVTASVLVSYQSEPLLGFLVPIEMRELYRTRIERVEGAATYGRFRQFQVKTGATIAKPPGREDR